MSTAAEQDGVVASTVGDGSERSSGQLFEHFHLGFATDVAVHGADLERTLELFGRREVSLRDTVEPVRRVLERRLESVLGPPLSLPGWQPVEDVRRCDGARRVLQQQTHGLL